MSFRIRIVKVLSPASIVLACIALMHSEVTGTSVCYAQQTDPVDMEIERRYELAGENADQLRLAWQTVPASQAPALKHLLLNMPSSDLKALQAEFLVEHVRLACEARNAAHWGQQIPEQIFLNEIVPYANVNERRDQVRQQLRDQFWPLVKDLDSISLAAAKLNQEVFSQLNVKYSTKRRRADQGPQESIETGLASCTGLSILLIDACRACGIPARFVGTPLWSDGSGNHSWVEVWDQEWHFTGAAEPTGDQLNQAWFTDRAAKATPGPNGIFAVSFQRTPDKFPMVWTRGENEVYCVEVTERYARPQKQINGMVDVRFRAFESSSLNRCQANLVIRNSDGQVVFRGLTRDESFDANDHLTASLPAGTYTAVLNLAEKAITRNFEADGDGKLVSLTLPEDPPQATQQADAVEQLRAYCKRRSESWTKQAEEPIDTETSVAPEAASDSEERGDAESASNAGQSTELEDLAKQPFAAGPLTREQAIQAKQILVDFHHQWMEVERRSEHAAKRLVIDNMEMKFDFKSFGEVPEGGRSLVISMHGGGGTTARVNDRQWTNQKTLYALDEGIYVAPRAPTDTWNLWHQSHIDAFFTRLIANMLAFENVNPNRVYITGYSAGGDGVYQLAPRMADQLAAAAMMAGHPNETQPLGLRNLPFTLHMGENDAAYDRNRIAKQWEGLLADLREQDPGGYEHWVKIHAGKGHWMDGDDAEGVRWLQQFTRKLYPERVVWLQDDVTHDRFYWLSVGELKPQPGSQVAATRDANHIDIERCDLAGVTILLDDAMLDLDQPVRITAGEQTLFEGAVQRSIANLALTLEDRGDPAAMFAAAAQVDVPAAAVP